MTTTPAIASSVGFRGPTVWADSLKKVNGDDWDLVNA